MKISSMALSAVVCFAMIALNARADPSENEPLQLEMASYKEVEALFERLGYTQKAWQSGIREIPPVYITNIPERWRNKYSREVSVATKKRLFFRLLGPIVLRANQLILGDREKLEAIKTSIADGGKLDNAGVARISEIATSYKMESPQVGELTEAYLDKLLVRVDVIPPSLALSQSAEESGWGTSRFADLGNAIFGQWTWGEGIKPIEQRGGKGNYKIATFKTPSESVKAYMHNLNTHPAYEDLREKRAQLRANGERLTGYALTGTLVNYSERGQEYVKSLRTIMRVNKLSDADDAHLRPDRPIFIIPVGSGSE